VTTIEKRGVFWRVKVRRAGLPAQTRTFDKKTLAQQWARSVESEIDKGVLVDRRVAQRLSLAEVLERISSGALRFCRSPRTAIRAACHSRVRPSRFFAACPRRAMVVCSAS
jgi:hypothetical protein